jgi:hypothetical protein
MVKNFFLYNSLTKIDSKNLIYASKPNMDEILLNLFNYHQTKILEKKI